jgi:hypothetical protein
MNGGGAPDADYFITYKRATGMKISGGTTYDTNDFTEALKVVGDANITGNISVGGWNSSSATHLGYQSLSGASNRNWYQLQCIFKSELAHVIFQQDI